MRWIVRTFSSVKSATLRTIPEASNPRTHQGETIF
jgi:hypothetical protein